MTPSMRKKLIGVIAGGGGAIAIASALITGPTGNDGLEGVRYAPYQDVVGVWTVCYGHTGKDIMLDKKYTEAECRALLSKDLNAVARQINPYIQKPIPRQCAGLCTRSPITLVLATSRPPRCCAKSTGRPEGACEQLRRWTYAKGKQWKGPVTRREIEREVCLWGQK